MNQPYRDYIKDGGDESREDNGADSHADNAEEHFHLGVGDGVDVAIAHGGKGGKHPIPARGL